MQVFIYNDFKQLLSTHISPGNGFVAVSNDPLVSYENQYSASVWTGCYEDVDWGDETPVCSESDPAFCSKKTRMVSEPILVGKCNAKQYFEMGRVRLYDQRDWEEIKLPKVTIFRMKIKGE